MDFRDTPAEAEYRRALADWLRAFVANHDAAPSSREWQHALYEAGYIAQTWPEEQGGKGLSPVYDVILNEEVARAGAQAIPPNVNYLCRAILEFGTEQQRDRFLLPTLRGDIQWCQGFSEPGAGSDLAALTTSGRWNGDAWVVNGQKLWTSGASDADWCLLLARSEPDAPKHQGISAFLIDMTSPGVSVRPVMTADGEADTCETFWDDVVVPADCLLGSQGDGWPIAMWALQLERGPADLGVVPNLLNSLEDLERIVTSSGLDRHERIRRTLSRAYIDVQILHLYSIRQVSLRAADRAEGPSGPAAKLLWARAAQAVGHAWLDALGGLAVTGAESDRAVREYFHSRPTSVYGGSAQIQRNLLAQRVLGMPRADARR
ncbi:hypothetical protein ACG83_33715 [Frankia sp. R43]|uniref:acyl-CoA dehydrogenase family protein n=1 Tax=Frankia sp. R43 TaxID=269536 RepID=UPI0006CA2010|nr:acyl-CoA dehydrogenase family protein [Frankia sp. R43]KPM51771.1 hypothetical protein ACG83_33715 [Frankia sp. R43]